MDRHPSGEVLDTCDNAISSAVLTIWRQRRCEWHVAVQDTCSVTIAPNRYKENSSTQCEPYWWIKRTGMNSVTKPRPTVHRSVLEIEYARRVIDWGNLNFEIRRWGKKVLRGPLVLPVDKMLGRPHIKAGTITRYPKDKWWMSMQSLMHSEWRCQE